jgi:hypothetical protein
LRFPNKTNLLFEISKFFKTSKTYTNFKEKWTRQKEF